MHTIRTALSIIANDEPEDIIKFPPHFTVQGKNIKDIRQQMHQEINNFIDAYIEENPDMVLIEEGTDVLNDI